MLVVAIHNAHHNLLDLAKQKGLPKASFLIFCERTPGDDGLG